MLEDGFCKSCRYCNHQGNDQSTVPRSAVRPHHIPFPPAGCRAGREAEGAAQERGKGESRRDHAHDDVRHDDRVCRGSGGRGERRKASPGSDRQVEGDES